MRGKSAQDAACYEMFASIATKTTKLNYPREMTKRKHVEVAFEEPREQMGTHTATYSRQ